MIEVRYIEATATLEVTGMNRDPDDPEHYWGDYDGINCGFWYNGVHSSVYHVEYIPDASDRWFEGTDWETYQKEISWRNGGYYYGNAAKVKTFTLKCYYEEMASQGYQGPAHF